MHQQLVTSATPTEIFVCFMNVVVSKEEAIPHEPFYG